MKEIQQPNFYNSISEKYIDTHLSIKACFETFLSNLLFKGDLKKVTFSQPDILFRQRLEMLDNGKTGDNYEAINLDLPFANYYQSTDFEDDDRFASVQASQSIIGQYSLLLGRKVRSLPVKATFKAQAFFSRRDDVRVAFQLFHWEKTPKYPVQFYDVRYYRGKAVAIPVLITIESISTNPEWKETDYLKQQRIFPIEVTFTVRTYQVLINNIDNFVDLPIKVDPMYREDDDSTIYLTNETLLCWSAEKFNLSTEVETEDNTDLNFINENQIPNVEINNFEGLGIHTYPGNNIKEMAEYYFNTDDPTSEQLEWLGGRLYNYQTLDIIQAYFDEEDRDLLQIYHQDIPSTTTNSVKIIYEIPADLKPEVFSIEFLIPSRGTIVVNDVDQTELVIDNLTPNSEYEIKIIVNSTSATKKLYNLTVKTLPEENYVNEENPEEIVLKPAINRLSALIGKNI